MADVQPLPTVDELARVLRCHVVTVHRAIAAGEIAAIKVRGLTRIPWSEWNRLTAGGADAA